MANRLDQILEQVAAITEEIKSMKDEKEEDFVQDFIDTIGDKAEDGTIKTEDDLWGFIYQEYRAKVKPYVVRRGGHIA